MAKGLKELKCKDTGLRRPKAREEWRDRICTVASEGNEAVQRQLAKVFGEEPAVLCAEAEQVVGQWERKARRRGRE